MSQEDQIPLLDVIDSDVPQPSPSPYRFEQSTAIWTENKAKLIQRYLYYFVLVTKHGNYIDGFAGPQKPENPDSWAARLVLSNEPRWLRKFFFFDKDPRQIQHLETLRDNLPAISSGNESPILEIRSGDFNTRVLDILNENSIRQTEATFCLLDQRALECEWSTVRALAEYKTEGHKIELFYFFPQGWIDRVIGGSKNLEPIRRWWGNDSWAIVRKSRGIQRSAIVAQRFIDELGYKYAIPWMILSREGGGRTMYTMIHATDHKDAPRLMHQAYREVISSHGQPEQGLLEFPEPDGTA